MGDDQRNAVAVNVLNHLCDSERLSIWGVNYGNRFIPEEWMHRKPDFETDIKAIEEASAAERTFEPRFVDSGVGNFFAGLKPIPNTLAKISLADNVDVKGIAAHDRMMRWLHNSIRRMDFEKMREQGVQIVRVPTGYWNWIDLGDQTPNCSNEVKDGLNVQSKFFNLQRMATVEDYKKHFDRLFDFAEQNGQKILLVLHGAPGAQGSDMHTGIVTHTTGGKSQYCFNTRWNHDKAIEACTTMVNYGLSKGSTFFGIQLLNEPESDPFDGELSVKSFYHEGVLACRAAGLPPEKPVIVFSWTKHLHQWTTNSESKPIFPYAEYGRVLFDTHIYHNSESWTGDGDNVCCHHKLYHQYRFDLEQISEFTSRGNEVIIGEWTLAMRNDMEGRDMLLEVEQHLVRAFNSVGHGHIHWNWDGPGAWSFCSVHDNSDVYSKSQARLLRITSFTSTPGHSFSKEDFNRRTAMLEATGNPSSSSTTSKVFGGFYGKRIRLRSWNDRYIRACEEHVDVECQGRGNGRLWEEWYPFFYKRLSGDGESKWCMSLKSHRGRFLTNSFGNLKADAKIGASGCEEFHIKLFFANGTREEVMINLQSATSREYVQVTEQGKLLCSAAAPSKWEQFAIEWAEHAHEITSAFREWSVVKHVETYSDLMCDL